MNVRTNNNNNGGLEHAVFCSPGEQHRDEVQGEENSVYQIVQLKGRVERNRETVS